MNPDPDCIRIKRVAQDRLDRETDGMSRQQRDAHVNRVAAEFAATLGFSQVSRPIGRGEEVTRAATPNKKAG